MTTPARTIDNDEAALTSPLLAKAEEEVPVVVLDVDEEAVAAEVAPAADVAEEAVQDTANAATTTTPSNTACWKYRWQLSIGIVAGLLLTIYYTCPINSVCLVGKGKVVTKESMLTATKTDIRSVVSKFPGNLYVEQKGTVPDGRIHMKVEARENILDKITLTRSSRGEWTIGLEKGHSCVMNTGPINVYLQAPSLTMLDNISLDGAGDISVKTGFSAAKRNKTISLFGSGDISAGLDDIDTLTTKLTGAGDITVTGSGLRHSATLGGSGDVHAFQFLAQNVTARIIGSGDIDVAANYSLDATIYGSGDIKYKGQPMVSQHIYGSGDVTKVG